MRLPRSEEVGPSRTLGVSTMMPGAGSLPYMNTRLVVAWRVQVLAGRRQCVCRMLSRILMCEVVLTPPISHNDEMGVAEPTHILPRWPHSSHLSASLA